MTTHAMIDLGTLSTLHNPVLLQLGVALFDPGGEGIDERQSWEMNVSVDSCTALGAVIDDGALDFWFKQPELNRWSVRTFQVPIRTALERLRFTLKANAVERVWSHGATFDLSIISWYLERLAMGEAWRYSAARDTRTLFEVAEQYTEWQRPTRDVAHTGLADAMAQAEDVQAAVRALGGLKLLGNVAPPLGSRMTEEQALRVPGRLYRHKAGGLYLRLSDGPGRDNRTTWKGNVCHEDAVVLTTYKHLWPHDVALYQRPTAEFDDPGRFVQIVRDGETVHLLGLTQEAPS